MPFRLPGGLLAALVAGCIACGPALATPIQPSLQPLPGSSFLGGNGSQDDLAPFVDWQFYEAAGRVVHRPDPNANDNVFAGGSKELEPATWNVTTSAGGATPAKSNILDAWGILDQQGVDTFLYLAFTRASSDGDINLAFELNHDSRTWNNGHTNIPCRRTGDVLLVVAGSGQALDLVVERWTTTVADASTGCGAEGTLTPVANAPQALVQGSFNRGPITSRLPGAYPPGTEIPSAGLFVEAGFNLSALLGEAVGDRCISYGSVWVHSRASASPSSSMQDYVAPQKTSGHTCAASGVKFSDDNANGVRDPGEPGIPRFLVWADYDNDGVRDADEPFSETDNQGDYLVQDIAPSKTFTLREALATHSRAGQWICSFPNATTDGGFAHGPGGGFGCGWGPFEGAANPVLTHQDFGNYQLATLTVEKELWPVDDPGRFDIQVNGQTVLPSASDGSSKTITLAPGTYDVTERAVPPALDSDYRSLVNCRTSSRVRSTTRAGIGFTGLVLHSGTHASCSFYNERIETSPVPTIAIEKTGPVSATAGDRLDYELAVTNPGAVAIPGDSVVVADASCDNPPVLKRKTDSDGTDSSSATLDPGDTWTYRCSNSTSANAKCPATVHNKATVDAEADGTKLTDDDSIDTELTCAGEAPGTPDPPETPGTPGTPGEPVVPPGPVPPDAEDSGDAGIDLSPEGGKCISRPSQVQIKGVRMSRVAVRIDGRLVRARRVAILARRIQPLAGLPGAGRHRLSVRVSFELGSGTPAVTIARTIAICASDSGRLGTRTRRPVTRRPSFTG